MKSANVLITGVNGFVGQHMAEYVLSQNMNVIGIGRQSVCRIQHPDLTYEPCHLLDQEQVNKLFHQHHIHYIIHLAAKNEVRESWESPVSVLETNVGGTIRLLDSVRRLGKSSIKGILAAGSALEYDTTVTAAAHFTEEAPLKPKSPYGWSKMLQTKASQMYAHLYDLPVIVARTFNLIGPGISAGVCSHLAQQVVDMELGKLTPEMVVGNIHVERDFLDVRDAVKAYWLLLQNKHIKPGEVFNVCRGQSCSIETIIRLLQKHAAKEFVITENSSLFRDHGPLEIRGDPHKICLETGWKPIIPLDQSIQELLVYHRKLASKRQT